MDNKILIILVGVGVLMCAPIWKCGQDRGLSALQVLAKHTILTKDPDKVMVEETYADLFRKAGFKGERHAY